jgi:hypothetical protein
MKKIWYALPIMAGIACVMIGANMRTNPQPVQALEKRCVGYTIIEAGRGIDCHGDTIRLIKKYGFYELASRYEDETDLNRALN